MKGEQMMYKFRSVTTAKQIRQQIRNRVIQYDAERALIILVLQKSKYCAHYKIPGHL